MSQPILRISTAGEIDSAVYGLRAARLAALAGLGLSVPDGLLLPADLVAEIAEGAPIPDMPDEVLGTWLLSLRASPGDPSWGGPPAILNIGMHDGQMASLSARVGHRGAMTVYRRFVQAFAVGVQGADPEAFENLYYDQMKLADAAEEQDLLEADVAAMLSNCKALYEEEIGDPVPQDRRDQLQQAIRAMARGWNKPTARILRAAKGVPEGAGMGLIVQRMALGIGGNCSGAGIVEFVDGATGKARIHGKFLPQAQGLDALMGTRTPSLITEAERAAAGQSLPALEAICPDALIQLRQIGDTVTRGLGEAFRLEFTVEKGRVWLLDVSSAKRSARAAVQVAVDLAEAGAITREQALLRIDPRTLTEHLHPQIDPHASRQVFANGLPASPGAATGKIVFTPEAAMAAEAQEEPCILVRVETSPEDIRGMHAAKGVLTARGGMTSHAAVIARGLGLPCVVGASDLRLNLKERTITAASGEKFREGDIITVDGTRGQALVGAPPMIQPDLGGAFEKIMTWADAVRSIGVRANADTPADARVARRFKVDGIGLCRTEHMFFEEDRINVMREMIMANTEAERRSVLAQLLPMQRGDFIDLFEIMHGLPVTIRLLDPPLHEFLPHSHDEMQDLAEAMDLPVSKVIARAEDLSEFNPMLGKRGVRLGVTMPEIYEMQARAIFEAAATVNRRAASPVVPEVMIPLVSANREVELVKARIDDIARQVEAEQGVTIAFKLGVMVETPRAALRAADLAESSAFLSFGTNDLTQMTYGLSRDDAGRFMRDYIQHGVFPEDPFHSLDLEGVGELLLLAARRGRSRNPNLTLGLCGEHGGDPASVRFCKLAGLDYVSCSPFRVPIARLAAAQATILGPKQASEIPQ